jgi:TolB-like protein/DNA-binding winged helix-turn-helix (wHTH) protein/Tfp pilus assembly protein PilF
VFCEPVTELYWLRSSLEVPMSSAKLRFRDYELDRDGFELCRAGHRLRLERKPMELLILLAEKQGQLVKREEIIEKIWGKDFFFDAENGVNNAVRKIRSALNDDSEQPRFVETSFGKGYRFIAPVEQVVEPAGPRVVQPDVIPQRTRAFRWRLVGIPALAVAALIAAAFVFDVAGIRSRVFARSAPQIHSIAVLPLENLSGDASQEYFADGMTDALITDLAQVSSLRVISRTSAMHYKGSHQALPAIARELNVDAVVEGTVIRSDDRVRITAQLLDARSDRHLWAKAYDRDIREIMSLQQDVADNIFQEIQAKLTPEENLRASRKRQVDPEAYDDYLRGLYFWNKFTREGMRRAAEYFEKSVQKDPSYSLGYAWLANAYGQLAVFVGPPTDFMPKSREATEKAMQLDDSLAEAHDSLANVKCYYDWDWAGADREFQRAIQLNPGNALIHGGYARYLDAMGRFEEASRQHEIMRELDPLTLIGFYIRGDHFLLLRQYDKAIAEFRAALDLDHNFFLAHKGLARAYKRKGMEKESISEWEQVDVLAGESDQAEATRIAYVHGGYKGVLKASLKAVQNQRAAGAYTNPLGDASIHAQLGNKDLAFKALEEAYAERVDMVWLNVDPAWDPIRSDPRFQNLLRRIGLPVNTAAVVVPH